MDSRPWYDPIVPIGPMVVGGAVDRDDSRPPAGDSQAREFIERRDRISAVQLAEIARLGALAVEVARLRAELARRDAEDDEGEGWKR